MSRAVVIAILLDGDSHNVCYVGQTVSGQVLVETSEQIKMRGIRLEISGKAHVHWTEGSGDKRRSYSGHERYMDIIIDLVGSKSRDSELYLQPGSYRYPVQFILSGDLPQSFQDSIGRVEYSVKAVIDRPWKVDDTAEIKLTVLRLLDLNREPPLLREPIAVQNENSPSGCCCFCCVRGLADIRATVNRGCFVATEMIIASGEIFNRTNTRIKYYTIAFVQKIDYHATTKTRHVRTVLASSQGPEIKPGCSDSWSNIGFVVTALPASRLDGCGIIDITYGIEVVATFHECCSVASLFIPVVIGHVALQNDFQSSAITYQPQTKPM